MTVAPVPMRWDGEAMAPLPNFARIADQRFVVGEVYAMAPVEDRSAASHRQYFAAVNEAFHSLPERLTMEFASADALRKRALIMTGHRNASVTVCMFKTEAKRVAALMQQDDEFAVVVVDGKTVTRLTAKSQSMPAMKKEEFQKSKDDVLGYLADLIGVAPEDLLQARAA